MNPPEYIKDIELEILNPPDSLMPKEDIRPMLSEYHRWAQENYDRSHREIIKFSDKAYQDDNSTWEIRRQLKGAVQPAVAAREDASALRWHLLLHLAYESERQDSEIRDMLNALKEKGSLVAGALHDPGEIKNSFTDMADLAAGDVPDALNIGLALDAWFGLFAGYLGDNDLLITCSNSVMDYVSMQWDDAVFERRVEKPFAVSLRLPDLFPSGNSGGDRLADKNNLHDIVMKIRSMIPGAREDPYRYMNELQALKREVEVSYQLEASRWPSEIAIRYFPPVSGGLTEDNKLLRHINGRIVIFCMVR